jgi:PTS system nitrogen regulatory IIA component
MSWFEKKAPEAASSSAQKSGPAPRAPKGLKIGPLLSEDVILFPHAGQGKDEILRTLAEAACRKAGLGAAAEFLAKAQEREQGISTTLDTGLSLPHARMDGIDAILAAMAVLKTPIADPKQNDLAIRVVFLFFSPNKPEAFPVHLQLLRGVSSLFQPALIDQLTAAAGPAEALALVRKVEG